MNKVNHWRCVRKICKASQERVMTKIPVKEALVLGTRRKQVRKQTVYSLKKTESFKKLKKKNVNLSRNVFS